MDFNDFASSKTRRYGNHVKVQGIRLPSICGGGAKILIGPPGVSVNRGRHPLLHSYDKTLDPYCSTYLITMTRGLCKMQCLLLHFR